MAYTDILNPKPGFDPKLGDSMCPNYGFDREGPKATVTVKAPGGKPVTRDVSNDGHTHTFSWLGRTPKCARRLKQFAEQFDKSCFTIVDWDGGGRHYVGRFTTIPKQTTAAFGKFDVQGVVFEEVPSSLMVEYPSDWDNDSITLPVLDDDGNAYYATSGATWSSGTYSSAGDDDAIALNTLESTGATAGDWLQCQYRGYGFQVWMQTGPAFGQVQVYLDGVLVTKTLDDGTTTNVIDLYAAAVQGPSMVLQQTGVPLDLHRLKVVSLASKNGASTSNAFSFVKLQVMR